MSSKKVILTSIVLYFLSQIFFLINIQFPKTLDFDEFHYVPAARKFLSLEMNKNWEHPPLGKILIATGMKAFGDRPIGWRFMSTVFGSLTLVAVYLLALLLFRTQQMALWTAGLTVANNLLYVQSRIGMLDTFMFGFVIWGMVAFCASWVLGSSGHLGSLWGTEADSHTPYVNGVNQALRRRRQIELFAFTGLMMGLATACKWFGVIPWVSILFIVMVVRLLQYKQLTFAEVHSRDWYRIDLWKELNALDFLVTLVVIPFVVYFLTFVPFVFIPGTLSSWSDLLEMQTKMWGGQLRVVSKHPYMSTWLQWPTLIRPIWYAFDREVLDSAFVRGVLLLGNPLVMWTGLIALAYCIKVWLYRQNLESFFIIYFYFVFYACWILIPRKIAFYYYYYPSGMMLSFAIAYAFVRLERKFPKKYDWTRWAYLGFAFALFIHFFPILAALRISINSFRQWMWFRSWI